MSGWYDTGLKDAHDDGYTRIKNGRIVSCNSYDKGASRDIRCDYCGKTLHYNETCNCEQSKW